MGSSTSEALALPARSQGPAGSRQAAPTTAIKRFVAWIRNERRVRLTINELMALDDHTLSDIGLSRRNIEQAVRSATPSTSPQDGVRR